MLVLWGRANAYNVQKVSWLLGELELECLHHDVGSLPGELETPEFLALNPHARIPVINDDGNIVWESNSILRYLASCNPERHLYADDAYQRSLVERWMDWELSKLQPDFIEFFWSFYRTPSALHDDDVINAARERCAGHLRQLDQQLEQQAYLAGDAFSVADICCGVFLYRYFEMGSDVEAPRQVMRWYQRLAKRPAFRSKVMTNFEDLHARLDF